MFFFQSIFFGAKSQENFRFQCDFSIKTKNFDSTLQLTVGSVFCDNRTGNTVYRIQFPAQETWLQTDSFFYKISSNGKSEKLSLPINLEQNIFMLILKNQLNTFGLETLGYELKSVKTEDSLTVLEWFPKKGESTTSPKILISRKKNLLFGIAFFSENGEIPLKLFFNKYITVNGLSVPTEIFKILSSENKESYEKTTFENIKINNFESDNFYNSSVPVD